MVKGGVYRIQSMMPKPQSFTANVKKFKILCKINFHISSSAWRPSCKKGAAGVAKKVVHRLIDCQFQQKTADSESSADDAKN